MRLKGPCATYGTYEPQTTHNLKAQSAATGACTIGAISPSGSSHCSGHLARGLEVTFENSPFNLRPSSPHASSASQSAPHERVPMDASIQPETRSTILSIPC